LASIEDEISDFLDEAGRRLDGLWQSFSSAGFSSAGFSSASFSDLSDTASEMTTLFEPVAPYNASQLLTPLVSLAAGVSVLVLAGVSVAALAALLASLLAVAFILAEVFGYDVSLANPGEFSS
jgi:hypothetical protein